MSNKVTITMSFLLSLLMISTDIIAMTPDPIFEDLTNITARCHITGDRVDVGRIEKIGCRKIEGLLRQRFGDLVKIEHLVFSDPAILDPNRLLVVLSGRIENAEGINSSGRLRYLSLTLSISRGGKSNSLIPVAPRVVTLPLGGMTDEVIGDLIGLPIEQLFRENGM
jgi:hypothetical protein